MFIDRLTDILLLFYKDYVSLYVMQGNQYLSDDLYITYTASQGLSEQY